MSYKILHIHYSGIVRNCVLLKYLLKYENISINKKGNVYFSSNIYNNKNKTKKQILYLLKNSNEKRFQIIGNLWYYIIKNCYFFYQYNRLIIYEMQQQNVKHMDFRIKLGSYFKNNNHQKLSIKDELLLFLNCYETLYKKHNKSFSLICCSSKSLKKKKVYQYFITILLILKKFPQFKKIIKAFDIVGDEINGNSLYYYEDIVKKISSKTNIPFYFHAGEHDHPKSIKNIQFALKYGGNRIAHGIYCIRDQNLMKQIKEKQIILEIAPISNLLLGNLSSSNNSIYYQLYQYGIKLSINTDDPNKLNDSNLQKNYAFLLKYGNFSQKDLNNILL